MSTTLAVGRFGELDVSDHLIPADLGQSRQKAVGWSDVYVQSNVWQPGGSAGWHTHPGHSLITVTAYEGDDPDCKPHLYTVGMGFVDPVVAMCISSGTKAPSRHKPSLSNSSRQMRCGGSTLQLGETVPSDEEEGPDSTPHRPKNAKIYLGEEIS